MKFVGKDPTKSDLSSPRNIVKFFLEANKRYPTQYSEDGPKHLPGRYRSVVELVDYCSQFGFTREQIMPEIPKQADVFLCSEILRYVMDPYTPFYEGDLVNTEHGRSLAKEMGIEIDKSDYL